MQKTMDYKRYDIVIIPPPDIAEQAMALSRLLVPFGSFFVLDGVARHPHLSLYRVPFYESVLPTVMPLIDRFARSIEPFLLIQDTYYPDQGVWVGVRYVANKALFDLHTGVIDALKPHRVIEDDARYADRWAEMTTEQRRNIEECGWAHAYTRYSPHMSFTKLQKPRADVLAHLPQRELSFIADHIGLYELGQHGAPDILIADFWLKKKN